MPSKKIAEHDLFVSPSVAVKELSFKKSDGLVFKKEIVVFRPGVIVVPVDAKNRVLLIREFRPVLGAWSWRPPAGKMDKKGSPLEEAKRELLEEGGIRAKKWKKIFEYKPEGRIFERLHYFLATGIEPSKAVPEAYEEIEVHWIPLAKAERMALTGKINDPALALAILRAGYELKRKKKSR